MHFSCQNRDNKESVKHYDTLDIKWDTIHLVEGNLIGKYPTGYWEYRSYQNKYIRKDKIYSDTSSKRIEIESKYYNNDGDLIYYEQVINGKSVEKFSIELSDVNENQSTIKGKILEEEYCSACHSLRKKMVGNSYEKIIQANHFNYINFKQITDHNQLQIEEQNLEEIKKYILYDLELIPEIKRD